LKQAEKEKAKAAKKKRKYAAVGADGSEEESSTAAAGTKRDDNDNNQDDPMDQDDEYTEEEIELATKEDFEKYRDDLLSKIPKSVKKRFREGGFSRWGKDWLPCLELGPFDVEPGPVRDMWIDMYNNVSVFCFLSVLSLHRLDRLESFILLSAFTTFTTKLSINYSFKLKTRLVSMDAKCHVSSFGTVSNLRREAKPTASCPAAN
jgi:hypothetical protein